MPGEKPALSDSIWWVRFPSWHTGASGMASPSASSTSHCSMELQRLMLAVVEIASDRGRLYRKASNGQRINILAVS